MIDSARVPAYGQWTSTDCGVACLRIVLRYHGIHRSHAKLQRVMRCGERGLSLLTVCEAARRFGLDAQGLETSYDRLSQFLTLPCIAHCNTNHFVVVYGAELRAVRIVDPALGYVTLTKSEFLAAWTSRTVRGKAYGVVAIFRPSSHART